MGNSHFKGKQKVESLNIPELISGTATFNETLTMPSNFYFEETKQCFLEKKSAFTVILVTSKGSKVAGTCNLDLSLYLNR